MNKQKAIIYNLSEYILKIHNQQNAVLTCKIQQSFNLSPLQSIALNLLTYQVNSSLQNLPQNQNHQPKYYEEKQFIIPTLIKKVGLISKMLSKLSKFNSKQERFLAEFKTIEFMKQFPAQTKPKYYGQQVYEPLFINFIKPIFPRMNVHQDNIPLYMPLYENLESYCQQTPIGNSSWELSRKIFAQVYRQEMSILDNETADEINLDQENLNNKGAWFQLLMCDHQYLNRYKNIQGPFNLWALLHFFYVQQTLKPYKNSHNNFYENGNQQEKEITFDSILDVLKDNVANQKDSQMRLLYSLILYQLTENTNDLIRIVQLVKMILEGKFSQLQQKLITNQDQKLNFAALFNSVTCQLLRNILEIHQSNQREMRDQSAINSLKAHLIYTVDLILTCVTHRLSYHDFYLRIAYPSNLQSQQEIQDNEQSIFNILQNQLMKDNQQNGLVYPFPQYLNFVKQFYERFSQNYLEKHPNTILQIVGFLPSNIIIWRLLSSPSLSQHQEFQSIRNILMNDQQEYLESIREKVPQVKKKDFMNFLQSWNYYHDLLKEKFQNYGPYDGFMEKLRKCKTNIDFLLKLQLPESFLSRVYFALDKSENVLRLTDFMIEGFEETLRQVDNQTQKEIVEEYSNFMNDAKFQSRLLLKLDENEKDQFWKKWSAVYLADQSLIKQLLGAQQSEIIENQPQPQMKPIQVIKKNEKKSQKQSNQVIVMDLED